MGLYIALIILWAIYAQLLLKNFDDLAEEISTIRYWLLVLIIFLGAPIFFLSEILEALLDLILPEGWNEDS